MILITGANGHLGSAAITFLYKKNPNIKAAALVRSEEKGKGIKGKGIEVRIGDYFDYRSLKDSFRGAETLMFISSSNLEERVKQHTNVVNAAKEAGVKQILYTSIIKAPELGNNLIGSDHNATEKLIFSSGIPYTIFRNTFYTEFFPMFLGNALETGNWIYPAGEQKMNLAARVDMAEAIANVLLASERHMNKIYEIVSERAYSFNELARAIGEFTGKKITYTDVPLEIVKENLARAGVPKVQIESAVAVADAIQRGYLNYTDNSLADLLGHKPVDLVEYIKQTLPALKA